VTERGGQPVPIEFVELRNRNGLRARLTNHGARLVELWCPGADGSLGDVVLGFDTIEEYAARASLYIGCTVGRVANRIAGSRFSLDGVTYELEPNDPPNHLHGGGARSFDKRSWSISTDAPLANAVSFRLTSPHLEEGYPGTIRARVTYALDDADTLTIVFEAETDRRTPINLTNHAYWNLSGGGSGARGILDHELFVPASRFTPVRDDLIPTGMIASVVGTPLDLRSPTVVGARIGDLEGSPTQGYDHNLVIDEAPRSDGSPRLVARLEDPIAGRVLDVLSTQPGLQVYSGQRLPRVAGKHGATYGPYAGLCLEAQGFPNAVNEGAFPPILVEPGVPYREVQAYRFGTRRPGR
jgi:aldose 1-epimerase